MPARHFDSSSSRKTQHFDSLTKIYSKNVSYTCECFFSDKTSGKMLLFFPVKFFVFLQQSFCNYLWFCFLQGVIQKERHRKNGYFQTSLPPYHRFSPIHLTPSTNVVVQIVTSRASLNTFTNALKLSTIISFITVTATPLYS